MIVLRPAAVGVRLQAVAGSTMLQLAVPSLMPIVPVGVAYNAVRRAFFAWWMPETKVPDALFRWDVKEGD